jgi:hypothetical protein
MPRRESSAHFQAIFTAFYDDLSSPNCLRYLAIFGAQGDGGKQAKKGTRLLQIQKCIDNFSPKRFSGRDIEFR